MLNAIFLVLIVGAVLVAAYTGRMGEINRAWLDAAPGAVELAIGLVGVMALWLGLMRVLRDAGLMNAIGRALAPVMRRLFPDVPADHPAMSAMILNLAANILGLGNAATPFGLKAMRELSTLSTRPGVATNAMATFLALNTSGVAVMPLGVIAVRASMGSSDPAGIFLPSVLATLCSTLVAVAVVKLLQHRPRYALERFPSDDSGEDAAGGSIADSIEGIGEAEDIARHRPAGDRFRGWAAIAAIACLAALAARHFAGGEDPLESLRDLNSNWLMPALMAGIVLFGFSRRVPVYESFIKGAREGFDIAVTIIPFLVAILFSVAMFRASGALETLTSLLNLATSQIGFPAEALPMALIRPLSGSGAFGVMTATMETYGPDSFVGYLVSIMNGSTETTFYVLAIYFGSVKVRAARHTVAACLCADFAGILAALFWARVFF